MLRHEWKPKSNPYQVLANVVLPHKNWLSSSEVAAAAALLGSSGCTLQQRRQDSPRAPILRVMKHKRQSGAMRSPALASYIALHQIRRAVSNSSYLPPTPPLLLFMDIELTLNCLRELCI